MSGKQKFNHVAMVKNPMTGERSLVRVAVEIDVEAIAKRLAQKAFSSKGKKSTFLYGAVTVSVDKA